MPVSARKIGVSVRRSSGPNRLRSRARSGKDSKKPEGKNVSPSLDSSAVTFSGAIAIDSAPVAGRANGLVKRRPLEIAQAADVVVHDAAIVMNQRDYADDGASVRGSGDRHAVERRQCTDLVQGRPRAQPVALRPDEKAVHRGGTQGRRRRRRQEAFGVEGRLHGEVERAGTAAEPTEGRVVAGAQAGAGFDEDWALAVDPDQLGVRRSVSDLERVEHTDRVRDQRLLALPLVRQELDRVVEDARVKVGGCTLVAPNCGYAVVSRVADRVHDVLRPLDELLHEDGVVHDAEDVRATRDCLMRLPELSLRPADGDGVRPNATQRLGHEWPLRPVVCPVLQLVKPGRVELLGRPQPARADGLAHQVLVAARRPKSRSVRDEAEALAELVGEFDAGLGPGEHVPYVEPRELRRRLRRAVVTGHYGDEIIRGERRAEEVGNVCAALDGHALMPMLRERWGKERAGGIGVDDRHARRRHQRPSNAAKNDSKRSAPAVETNARAASRASRAQRPYSSGSASSLW